MIATILFPLHHFPWADFVKISLVLIFILVVLFGIMENFHHGKQPNFSRPFATRNLHEHKKRNNNYCLKSSTNSKRRRKRGKLGNRGENQWADLLYIDTPTCSALPNITRCSKANYDWSGQYGTWYFSIL